MIGQRGAFHSNHPVNFKCGSRHISVDALLTSFFRGAVLHNLKLMQIAYIISSDLEVIQTSRRYKLVHHDSIVLNELALPMEL